LTIGFSMSHQPGLCVIPNFPIMDSDTQNCHFWKNFHRKLQSFIV